MNSNDRISHRSSHSKSHHQQQQWQKSFINGATQRVNSMKKEKTPKWFTEEVLKNENDKGFELYADKWRKSAVKSNPTNVHLNKVIEMGENFVGLKQPKNDKLEETNKFHNVRHDSHSDYYDKRFLLEEFRRVYREFETGKNLKQSVRTDFLAWGEMEKRYGKVLEPIRTVGEVTGVEIGDVFNLRLELIIMGIHFQQVNGIDYTRECSTQKPFATSIVATEGYEDNMKESNVLVYTGEGGSFEKGKKVKDQVLTCGNLALRNSMEKRLKVRVVRGLKCGGGGGGGGGRNQRSIFVYDGLYTVDDYWVITGSCGNKKFQFKLVRCCNQKPIVWAKYKQLCVEFEHRL